MTNYPAITIISILLIIVPTISKNSYSLVVANNPFYSMSDSKIHNIKSHTPDGKMLVNLEYSPDEMKSGAITFFKINFLDSAGKARTRHVDCDLIIRKDNLDLFKASEQYGEPSIHSPDGIMLTSFGFNETGNYRISVEIEGLNFFPIKPLFVDFGATVSHLSDGSLKIVLST
jgi:hypothetical protein